MTTRTEAADLARIILVDSEADLPNDLYPLNVREARTLARAALAADRVEELADRLSAEAADDFDGVSGTSVSLVKYETAKAIRAILNGETDA